MGGKRGASRPVEELQPSLLLSQLWCLLLFSPFVVGGCRQFFQSFFLYVHLVESSEILAWWWCYSFSSCTGVEHAECLGTCSAPGWGLFTHTCGVAVRLWQSQWWV